MRLTERIGNSIQIKGCSTLYSSKERKGAPASNAVVRLAAYEDTGPTPEEITDLLQAEENRPLTLEELREMDGEPVWIVCIHGGYPSEWMLVNAEELCLFNSCGDYLEFYDIGRNVLAYRRKLEEGTT